MSLIEELRVAGFRGQTKKLEGLAPVTVLVGTNESGKSTMLDALDLSCHQMDASRLLRVARRRAPVTFQYDEMTAVRNLFPLQDSMGIHEKDQIGQFDLSVNTGGRTYSYRAAYSRVMVPVSRSRYPLTSTPVPTDEDYEAEDVLGYRIILESPDSSEEPLSFSVPTSYPLPMDQVRRLVPFQYVGPVTYYTTPSAHVISQSILSQEYSRLMEVLRIFDRSILELMVLSSDTGRAVPFVKHSEYGTVPFGVFGDGLRRAFVLSVALAKAANGVLCVDEIESGLHISVLIKFFQWLLRAAAAQGVQLIMTTHSLEVVDALVMVCDDMNINDGVVLHRLERGSTTRFSYKDIHTIRTSMGQDVR